MREDKTYPIKLLELDDNELDNLEQLLLDFIYDQELKADKAVLFDVLTRVETLR
jgi:hypothetical protein